MEEIRRLRREFVLRWNVGRGQEALGRLPPASRVEAGNRRDMDYARLEDLAHAPLGTRVVDPRGFIAYFGRRIPVGRRHAGQRVELVLTLEGAEILLEGKAVGRFDWWAMAKAYSEARGE